MNSERIDVHTMKRRKKTAVPTRLIEAMLDIALLAEGALLSAIVDEVDMGFS